MQNSRAPRVSFSKTMVYVSYTWLRTWECQTTNIVDGKSNGGGGGFKYLLDMFTLSMQDRF